MMLITVVFLSMGALLYAAYGSRTQTVVLLNLPQDDRLANGAQLAYSLAILQSTLLQLFPAIRITKNAVFARGGYGARGQLRLRAARLRLSGGRAPMLHLKAVPGSRRQRFADVMLAVFSLVVMVYTTALTIKSWIDGKTVKPPGFCDRPGSDTRPGRGLLANGGRG
ncbi:MAG: neutral amino acid transporter [Phylliscum demangeonii]|nr:MAG: neutral amino acid transporter [Phylliscum demangeonii]